MIQTVKGTTKKQVPKKIPLNMSFMITSRFVMCWPGETNKTKKINIQNLHLQAYLNPWKSLGSYRQLVTKSIFESFYRSGLKPKQSSVLETGYTCDRLI